jgi:hypothetical protein
VQEEAPRCCCERLRKLRDRSLVFNSRGLASVPRVIDREFVPIAQSYFTRFSMLDVFTVSDWVYRNLLQNDSVLKD